MSTLVFNTLAPKRVGASSALSMPGLLGLYFGLRVTITLLFFRSDPQTGTSFSLALNLILLAPFVFYSAGPAAMNLSEMLRTKPFRFVLLFLGLSFVSLSWSEAQSIVVAFSYWAALAADVVLVVLVQRAESSGTAFESLTKGFVWGVLLLSVVAWTMPTMPDLRIGNDDFLSPNVIGFECALGTLLCQYLAPQGARWKWLGAALAITLLRSLSKTSILAFLFAEAFFLFRAKTITRLTKIAVTAGALLVVVIFSGLFVAYYIVYTHAGTQAETLTGRTVIWISALSFAMQEPWLGHGFHSFHAIVPAFGPYRAWHAHNELLQQFFNYGIVGVVLVVALYVSLFRQIYRSVARPIALLAQSLLVLVFVRGFADTERFDLSLPLWMMTAITLSLSQAQEASL